jgi:MraZ protein
MPVLFTNSYELKVDLKHRLFVPTEVRKLIYQGQLGEAFYVTMGHNQLPWLYPEKTYEALLENVPLDAAPDDEQLDYVHLRFALASKVAWDEGGRLVLPDQLLDQAGVSGDLTLTGCKDHLELWPRAAWDAHRTDVWQRARLIIESKRKQQLNAVPKL